MPQSKNRKKRIADHHKRLERTRRKLERERANSFSGSLSGASERENSNFEQDYIAAETHFVDSRAVRLSVANRDDDKTLWGGFSNISNLYSWCHSGLASVSETDTLNIHFTQVWDQVESTLMHVVVWNLHCRGWQAPETCCSHRVYCARSWRPRSRGWRNWRRSWSRSRRPRGGGSPWWAETAWLL